MCYHILKYKVPCKELGPDYLDKHKKDRTIRNYIKKLTGLGFTVTANEAVIKEKAQHVEKGRHPLVAKTP